MGGGGEVGGCGGQSGLIISTIAKVDHVASDHPLMALVHVIR